MPPPLQKPVVARPRTRANRLVGQIWLVVLFFFLLVINLASVTIEPMLGTLAPLFKAALIVATVWNGVLLTSIGWGHGWARYVLAGFLFSFGIGEILFVINIIVQHPSLNGEPIRLLAIVVGGNIFAGIYLLFSADIRQIGHHVID